MLTHHNFDYRRDLITRIAVYPKDLSELTGRGLRYCQRIISNARCQLKKSKYEPITKREIAEFLKLPMEDLEHWNLD